MAWPTLATYKAWASITEATDDDLLTGLLARAQAIIEGPLPLGTARTFTCPADTTRYVDAPTDGGRLLPLWEAGDICAITTIVNGDGATVSSGEYVTAPRYGQVYHGVELKSGSSVEWAYTTSPEAAIAVTGRWAFSTDVPEDIKQAFYRLVDFMYRSKGGSGDQAVQTSVGVILPSRLPKDVDDILNGYRRQIWGAG